MCCTMTAAVATPTGVRLAHVGDSLAWLVLDGQVTRLTADQTIAAQLVREGKLDPADVATHPKRGTLFQAVGNAKPLDIDVSEHELAPGDRLVLATDGLHYAGDADHLEALLAKAVAADELCDLLVDAALQGGGHDNVTVVVADLTAGDAAATQPRSGGIE
jgi:protein phosphatase